MMDSAEQDVAFFPVEFALNVEGRGLTVLCQFPDPTKARVRAGDPLEFLRPDGTTFRTTAKALGMAMGTRPGLLGLCLPAEVARDDIPYGSKIRIASTTV